MTRSIKAIEIARIANGNQRTLYQCGTHKLISPLGYPPAIVRIVGLANTRHNADIGSQFIRRGKVIDIANARQQDRRLPRTDALDAGQPFKSHQLFASSFN